MIDQMFGTYFKVLFWKRRCSLDLLRWGQGPFGFLFISLAPLMTGSLWWVLGKCLSAAWEAGRNPYGQKSSCACCQETYEWHCDHGRVTRPQSRQLEWEMVPRHCRGKYSRCPRWVGFVLCKQNLLVTLSCCSLLCKYFSHRPQGFLSLDINVLTCLVGIVIDWLVSFSLLQSLKNSYLEKWQRQFSVPQRGKEECMRAMSLHCRSLSVRTVVLRRTLEYSGPRW